MTQLQHTCVVGIFDRLRMAQQAVDELRAAGFMEKEIGLVARSVEVTQIPADGSKHDEKVADGALGGILTGAGLGGLWAVGIEIEMLPAIGELILGGLFTSMFAGAVAGAAAGGVVGALVTAGLPREEAERFEQAIQAGRIVVTVRTDDNCDKATEILKSNGAELNHGEPLI